jgi:hypothetical protein
MVSWIGLVGGLCGFLTFFLPRLWIAIGLARGEEVDRSWGAFWEFAVVAIPYALTIPASAAPLWARWALLLVLAVVAQLLAFRPAGYPQLALPATVLLAIAVGTSAKRWLASP